MERPPFRIGTRGSPLALAQAHAVRDALIAAHADLAAPGAIEIVIIKTTGDAILDRTLAAAGGKGLFTKEIEDRLLAGEIDIAVHSAKDMTTTLPDGLFIAAVPPREDTRDSFLGRGGVPLAALPPGAVVGTAALRRQALLLRLRPDLRIVPLRGNVQTRLRRLEEGAVEGTILALAGLRRLGLAHLATEILPSELMPPAVAQGAVAIEAREGDTATAERLRPLDDAATAVAIRAERAFLAALDGSCRTPIAGLATLGPADRLSFRGLVIRPDGSEAHETTRDGPAADAERLGRDAGEELRGRAGAGFFDLPLPDAIPV